MKNLLLALALLVAQAAQADTAIGTPTPTSCTVKRGSTTVATITGGTASDCRLRAAADAETRKASAIYTITTIGSPDFHVDSFLAGL